MDVRTRANRDVVQRLLDVNMPQLDLLLKGTALSEKVNNIAYTGIEFINDF